MCLAPKRKQLAGEEFSAFLDGERAKSQALGLAAGRWRLLEPWWGTSLAFTIPFSLCFPPAATQDGHSWQL